MVRPKKHLGQHFLTDRNLAQKIIELLPYENSVPVLEIGPGKGILTDFLLQSVSKRFLALDVDNESIQFLKHQYPTFKEAFLQEDFLKSDLNFFNDNPFYIIGNFPYNISSQIFFKILDNKELVPYVVGMVQREVAERIASSPGNKTYGILSVLLQAFYDIKIHFHVKPGSFYPPPAVNSSVITLKRNQRNKLNCNEVLFKKIVKTTFNQRRKTIRNTLKTFLLNLGDENEVLTKRPEQLSVKEFEKLTLWVEKQSEKT
ncbi:MAG TPA: 16S rRNA (adenine(1518)-N(6)/adenine(1519)-N(6))-dimethyltransferase RsmA [Bacteroidales bacterium]|nr:16S rRNA (adenine(1518)-N(6)/adenine(1519)-N(6))-dimethyltransferase RsmA [Bacteroidales bacterium]